MATIVYPTNGSTLFLFFAMAPTGPPCGRPCEQQLKIKVINVDQEPA